MRNNNSLPRKRRHKRIMKLAKGFLGSRSKHFRSANEAVVHSLENRTISRKLFRRDIKRLWITRINTFSRTNFNLPYSKFINIIKTKNVLLNKKIISDMIFSEKEKTIEFFKKVIIEENNE